MRLQNAITMAMDLHSGQKRKDTGDDYIFHPLRVMARVLDTSFPEPKKTTLAIAAVLHDTVEDTTITIKEIEAEFGEEVAGIVRDLTHANWADPRPSRKDRLAHERERLSRASQEVAIIKAFDRIDNLHEMERSEKVKWMRSYASESVDLLVCLNIPSILNDLLANQIKCVLLEAEYREREI